MQDEPTEVAVEVLPPEAATLIKTSDLEVTTAKALENAFSGFFRRADEWTAKAKAIVITDASQKREMELARTTRLALREIRLEAEKVRKALKEDSLRKGKAIDGMANILKAIVEPLEQHLLDQEKFAERQEADRRARLKEEREAEIQPYVELVGQPGFALADMTDDQWAIYMNGVKERADKITAERIKAEEERQKREKAEAEERDRLRKENERLALERAEAERKARQEREEAAAKQREADEKAAKERKELEAKAAAERAAREKLEQEKREREQAEAKRKADEEAARLKAAQAPDREKLDGFALTVSALHVPEVSSPAAAEVRAEIQEKVAAFARWIRTQTSTL